MPAAADYSQNRSHIPSAVISTPAGERDFLRGPRDSAYRLTVSGEIGAKELGKIIRSLQQQLLLEGDEESEARPEQ